MSRPSYSPCCPSPDFCSVFSGKTEIDIIFSGVTLCFTDCSDTFGATFILSGDVNGSYVLTGSDGFFTVTVPDVVTITNYSMINCGGSITSIEVHDIIIQVICNNVLNVYTVQMQLDNGSNLFEASSLTIESPISNQILGPCDGTEFGILGTATLEL